MRIICAFLIYARHSITMYGCTYSHYLDALFVELTSPVMTCFFVMSGFSIHYQHKAEELSTPWVKKYLKKRMISIMPSYLLVVIIWPLVFPEQAKNWALLLPVDIIGIQTSYRTLFGILHNGGTWFVSCILFAYLSYPVMKAVLDSKKTWHAVGICIVSYFILAYSNIIIPIFSLDGLYSNPIARTGEFIIGVAFADLIFSEKGAVNRKDTKKFRLKKGGEKPFIILVCLASISAIIGLLNNTELRTMIFVYYPIPVVLLLLLFSSKIHSSILEKSKILSTLSGISYQFFLMQLFLWNITTIIMQTMNLSGNVMKIVVSFALCTILSYAVWKLYDKPIRKMLKKRFLSNDC